jgi:phosphate transport system substrate-binding protein
VVLAGVDCFRAASAAGVAKEIERPEAMAAELASVAGSLGMTTAALVEQSNGRIKALSLDGVAPSPENVKRGEYRLVRSVYLITRARIAPATQRFLSFVRSAEGARVIRANGGVPLE